MLQTDRLRKFIAAQGGTQAQFADKMNFARETVSRAVTGSAPISPDFKSRFIDVFGIDAYREVFGPEPAEAPA